jgi:hypothetical protein
MTPRRFTVRHPYAKLCLVVLVGGAAFCHAQLPTNSGVWKDRCNLLASNSGAIQNGQIPPALAAMTHGVAARGYFVLAVDRAQAKQHYVACTMYYLAAIAERQGNGAKPDLLASTNDAVVGGSELKLARGHHLNMHEHVTRVRMKVEEMRGQPLALSPPQTTAVLDASTTMPISLIP